MIPASKYHITDQTHGGAKKKKKKEKTEKRFELPTKLKQDGFSKLSWWILQDSVHG